MEKIILAMAPDDRHLSTWSKLADDFRWQRGVRRKAWWIVRVIAALLSPAGPLSSVIRDADNAARVDRAIEKAKAQTALHDTKERK